MSVTPKGDHYPLPASLDSDDLADRVTRVAGLVDGGDTSGLIGWAVNLGAQGAVETVADWGFLPPEEQLAVAKKRGHALRSASSRKGTNVHQVIDKVLRGEAQPWQLEAAGKGYFVALRAYLDAYQPIFIDSERTLYGTMDGDRWWAGTCDLLADVTLGPSPGITIIDWKTGKPHLAYQAQMGGYLSAQHFSPDGADLLPTVGAARAQIVYLDANGTFAVDHVDADHAKALWAAAWNLHLTITNARSK